MYAEYSPIGFWIYYLYCGYYHPVSPQEVTRYFVTFLLILIKKINTGKLKKYIQGIHKRMVRFQKWIKNICLTLHGPTYTVSGGNCPSFSCATSSSLLVLTAWPRGQFQRWLCSRPLQRTCYTGSGMSLVWMCVVWPRVHTLKDCNYQMRNLDSCRRWRCVLCPCKVRHTFFIHFWYRTILLCMPCIEKYWIMATHWG
jgi:hypothetical protein